MQETTQADDAVARCRATSEAHPDDAGAWVALGHALWLTGQQEEALAALERALVADPDCADAHNNLGNAALESGDKDRAVGHYEAALRARPEHAEAHYNLGNALLAVGRPEDAIAAFDRAIALKPDHVGAHNNLGNVLRSRGRIEEALASYRRALALRPDYVGTRNNMAITLLALHRPHEALAELHLVLGQQPDHAEAANNIGGAMLALNRLEEALEAFQHALVVDPDLVQARFGIGLAQLGLGRLVEGWEGYEARWLDPLFREGRADPGVPRWTGEEIAGKRILLQAEQGFGDTIQFARYIPLVQALGAEVVLQVPATLKPLLAQLVPGGCVLVDGETPPPVDLHCPLLSLPRAFATDLTTIPAAIPYLHADARRVARFGYIRPARDRLRVGVAFSGSPMHTDDALRSIPAATFLPPLLETGVMLHVLQTQFRDADAAVIVQLDDVDALTADIQDFADTAALVSLMDLVITVDTSVAHVAGAMGVPTWLLLQYSPDFRWMRERTDSPWYPTMRLFRQPAPQDWDSVLAAVRQALLDVLAP